MKALGLIAALAACGKASAVDPVAANLPKLAVTSPAFAANAEIPTDHTCEGADHAPPLAWSGAPPQTKGFALVVDDPDAPGSTFVHWVRAAIPATTTSLPADAGLDGQNDFGSSGWRGPCPPSGRHRYFFKIYALDAVIGAAGMAKPELLAAIKGHVIAAGELIGTYEKHGR
jgi:Raf kinase inhibitor-like YbhB/YbcL family protein